MPPRPGGVEIAAIVSPLNITAAVCDEWRVEGCYSSLITLLIGINRDLAVFAVALAFASDTCVFCEGEVNDAPLVGGHRVECEWDARSANFFSGLLCHQSQLFFALRAIAARIENKMLVFAYYVREHAVAEIFERVEQLGIVAEQQRAVSPPHLYFDRFTNRLDCGLQLQVAQF